MAFPSWATTTQGFEGWFEAAPGGSVWFNPRGDYEATGTECDGVANFDGASLVRFLRETCIYALDVAPDGSVWLQAGPAGKGHEGPDVLTYAVGATAVADAVEAGRATTIDAVEAQAVTDVLPGVELLTLEVAPGVLQVVDDGVRPLSEPPGWRVSRRIRDVTVTPEGHVWIEVGDHKDWSIIRLGERGTSLTLGRAKPWALGLTRSGALLVTSPGGTRVFDGETWVRTQLTAEERCPGAGGADPDGSCRSADAGPPLRFGPGTVGASGEVDPASLRPAPDGSAWTIVDGQLYVISAEALEAAE